MKDSACGTVNLPTIKSPTPYKKDLLKSFVDAFRAEGIRIGFYYSLIDWHHPDFVYDGGHPPTPVTKEEREKANAGRDMRRYQEYMRNQVTELLTKYGKIDQLFLISLMQVRGVTSGIRKIF